MYIKKTKKNPLNTFEYTKIKPIPNINLMILSMIQK